MEACSAPGTAGSRSQRHQTSRRGSLAAALTATQARLSRPRAQVRLARPALLAFCTPLWQWRGTGWHRGSLYSAVHCVMVP